MADPDYSELCKEGLDALENIRSYLPLQNYIKWGPISASWSSIARNRHLDLPFLVFYDAYKENATRFFSLSTQRVYQIDFPELRGCHICGSSHGWLVTIDINLQIQLFDPFSRSIIKLPLMPLSEEDRDFSSSRFVDYHQGLMETSKEELLDKLVYKVILSADPRKTSNYIAIASSHNRCNLGFWKSGDAAWTTMEDGPKWSTQDFRYGLIQDFLLHKGKLYVLSERPDLWIVDLVPHPKLITCVKLDDMGMTASYYLVDVKGEVLLVMQEMDVMEGMSHMISVTTSFRILKFDTETWQTSELKSIGDNVLFLGGNRSMVFPSNELLQYQKDKIYFTYNKVEAHWPRGFEDRGVFNIKDGTIEPFPPNDRHDPTKSSRQIWLARPW